MGAVLKNLKLKNPVLPPLSKPGYFPTHETIEELDKDVIEVNVQPLSTGNTSIEEIEEIEEDKYNIDPDDVLICGNNNETLSNPSGGSTTPETIEGTIGHNLVKVRTSIISFRLFLLIIWTRLITYAVGFPHWVQGALNSSF